MNTKGRMSFRNVLFPQNPRELTIRFGRRFSRTEVPEREAFVKDMGEAPAVVSGEGEFFGDAGLAAFQALQEMQQRGAGVLYLPSRKPMRAVLEQWELLASDREGVISYRFRFVEARDDTQKEPAALIADGKICLWDVAYRFDREIGELLQKNPAVARPDQVIPSGKRVFL